MKTTIHREVRCTICSLKYIIKCVVLLNMKRGILHFYETILCLSAIASYIIIHLRLCTQFSSFDAGVNCIVVCAKFHYHAAVGTLSEIACPRFPKKRALSTTPTYRRQGEASSSTLALPSGLSIYWGRRKNC